MENIFEELERSFNRVGLERLWKRRVGGVTLWFSPISLSGQEKVSELLTNSAAIGSSLVYETKRMSLSHSIVGFNELDLRPYKDGSPCVPSLGKDGKPTKITLDKFIYNKLGTWSAQLVDDAFAIYADILETHQKENLDGVVFENRKDPEVELKELEQKVAELREQLGKPQLVEPDVASEEVSLEDRVSNAMKNFEEKERIEIIPPSMIKEKIAEREMLEDSSFADPFEIENSVPAPEYTSNPRMGR